MSITYQELVLILPIKFHPHFSTLRVFQDFWFPRFSFHPSTPYVSNCKWSIWDMRSFYISSFIKIQSPTHKINIPSFSWFGGPPAPHRWSNRGNDCSKVNFCRSLTRLPIFIILARPEATNSPKHRKSSPLQLPQRDRIRSGYINYVSRTLTYSSHQVSSLSLHSKRFLRFLVSLLTPPNVTRSGRDLK